MSDKCKHHVFIWERCEACIEEAIREQNATMSISQKLAAFFLALGGLYATY